MINIEELKALAAAPGDTGYDRLAFWMADHAQEIIRELEEARRESECRQSKIDSLMLEYCPDEMTPEQVAEWGRHQRRCDPNTPPKTPDAT